jgi:hypothetical protein
VVEGGKGRMEIYGERENENNFISSLNEPACGRDVSTLLSLE